MASLPAATAPTAAADVASHPPLPSRPTPTDPANARVPGAARPSSPESYGEHFRSADDVEGDDAGDSSESEWEYEYSTTETETYYLTVDLSIPDFAQLKDDTIIHNTRGGYRSWFNPMLEKPDITGVFDNDDYDDNNNNNTDGARRRGGRDQAGAAGDGGVGGDSTPRPGSRGSFDGLKGGLKRKADDEPLQVQIMDLHTERPLIAHRGMVFTGTWASNIGTELIFTEPFDEEQEDDDDDDEDDDDENAAGTEDDGGAGGSTSNPDARNEGQGGRGRSSPSPGAKGRRRPPAGANKPLPHIAALGSGATLLAASSARLQCRPTTLTARSAPRRRHEAHRAARAANGFAIHVADDRTGQRRPQARFLERLAALKRARGEGDDVTVSTVENPDDAVEDDSDEAFEREKKARKRGYESGRKTRRMRLQRANDGGAAAADRRRRRRLPDRRGPRNGGNSGEGEGEGEAGEGEPGSYVGLDERWWFGATNPDLLQGLSPTAAGIGDGQAMAGGGGYTLASPAKRRRMDSLGANAHEAAGTVAEASGNDQ